MSRHADRRKARIFRHVEVDHTCRLRRIQNQRHACLIQQRGDAVQRSDIAEHIGHVVQDHQIDPIRERLLRPLHHAVRVPKRRVQHNRLNAAQRERPHDRIMLIPANRNTHTRLHQRMNCQIERVRGVHCQHDLRRVGHAEQRCRLLPASVHRFARLLRRGITAARIPCRPAQRLPHGFFDRARLMQRGCGVIQIDHAPAPSSGNTRQGEMPSCRKRCKASSACPAPTRTAQPQDSVCACRGGRVTSPGTPICPKCRRRPIASV